MTETRGMLAPETDAAARAAYESVRPAAETVVRAVARLWFDADEFATRTTAEATTTAHDALFASLLEVRVDDREGFETWREGFDGEVIETGSQAVDNVAWHVAPAAGVAVATTFADDDRAAAEACRRQAFGRVYRDRVADR